MLDGDDADECDLTCPKCHKLWARLKFRYESIVKSSDLTILHNGRKKKPKNGDALKCTACDYEYKNYDVFLAISEKNKVEAAKNE